MKKSVIVLSGILCYLMISTVFAAENIWQGTNGGTDSGVTNIDDVASWSLNQIPGVGNDDNAYIGFYESGSSTNWHDLYVSSTNQFNPKGLYFHGNASGTANNHFLFIDKSLSLTNLVLKSLYSSGGSIQHQNRFRVGTLESGTTLTLTGNGEVFDISSLYWKGLNLASGSAIDFTGTNIIFSGNSSGDSDPSGSGTFYFTNTQSTVYLKQNGAGTSTMRLGGCRLSVATNIVWNADTNAYVQFAWNNTSLQDLISSPDTGDLSTLQNMSVYVNHTTYGSGTGFNIRGGNYGSFYFSSGGKRGFQSHQTGNVTLNRNCPKRDVALLLTCSASNNRLLYYTDGYDFKVFNSVWLDKYAFLLIRGSEAYIQNDIRVLGNNRNRLVGLVGDADSILSFGGSYSNDCMSVTGQNNLDLSTVNAVGNGINQYFEVGDDSNQFAVASSSFAIDTFNIGAGTTNATVTLVNNFQNDNPVVSGTEDEDKMGERLIVNNLSIAADSKLDVNNQDVIITTGFTMDSTAVLDLNIVEEVGVGDVITSFYGDGDQSASWSTFEDQVINGGETTGFAAYYDSTADKTYWKVSSAGGGTILIIQ